ncbi:hypothetical protein Tco_0838746 [Tanacetum coccineum]|uniref:Transposase n=1 Tax=Tanacetum coccineum TaxID=301880 RepID=A0ABQ5ATP7_9ASTR
MASESASDSATTGVGSTSALGIREIIQTTRNNEIWKDFTVSLSDQRIKGAAESESGSGANVDGKRWANFHVQSGLSCGTILWLLIQRGLPFNHFDHEQTTRVFQNTMQPRYTHVSRSTLKRDAMKLWVAAKQATIDAALNPCFNVSGVDFLIENISRDLEFEDDGFATRSLDWFSRILSRLLTIRRTRLTPESLEMCMCLKDHLDAQERKQNTSPLELPLDVEEGVFNDEVQQNEATQLTDQEIALDAR